MQLSGVGRFGIETMYNTCVSYDSVLLAIWQRPPLCSFVVSCACSCCRLAPASATCIKGGGKESGGIDDESLLSQVIPWGSRYQGEM